jgi:hypothetical protein
VVFSFVDEQRAVVTAVSRCRHAAKVVRFFDEETEEKKKKKKKKFSFFEGFLLLVCRMQGQVREFSPQELEQQKSEFSEMLFDEPALKEVCKCFFCPVSCFSCLSILV